MLHFISQYITNEKQTTKYGISTDSSERMKLASSFAAAKVDAKNKLKEEGF